MNDECIDTVLMARINTAETATVGRPGVRLGQTRLFGLMGEATWIVTGQITAAVGGIVGVPLLAHCLRPEDYGRLALGGTIATLVQQLSFGPVGNAGGRFYAPAVESGQLRDYLLAAGGMVRDSIAAVAVVASLGLAGLACSPWHNSVALAFWSLVFAVLSGISSAFDGVQSAARQRAIVAWHQGLGVWLRFGCAALLVRMLGGVEMAMVGFAAASVFVTVSQILFFRRAILSSPENRPSNDPGAKRRFRGQMWSYAWPFGSWGLFTWAQVASDRWALEAFTTTRGVGLYQALYQIGYYPISMVIGFLTSLIGPILFARVGDGTDEARVKSVHRTIRWLFAGGAVFSAGAVLVASLIHERLFRLLLPPSYASLSYLLPMMVLASGLFACGQIATLRHVLSTSPRSLVVPKIATAVLGVALNLAGAYEFGVVGVVAAGICFATVYCVWVLLAADKPERPKPPALSLVLDRLAQS